MFSVAVGLAAAVMLQGAAVSGGNTEAGEQLYRETGCIACHGAGGNSADPDRYPSLAGLDEAYVKTEIMAFREGSRGESVMNPIVAGLTDEQAADLAAYLAARK